jgi:hypothetical protein
MIRLGRPRRPGRWSPASGVYAATADEPASDRLIREKYTNINIALKV